jgi:hypothetical protein
MVTAIDSHHVQPCADGKAIITTWHNTRREAQERIDAAGALSGRVHATPKSCLGAFKAVTMEIG